jgi:hypothetical protein
VERNFDSQIGQLLAEPLTIGVEPLARSHFIADRDDFCSHKEQFRLSDGDWEGRGESCSPLRRHVVE